MHMPLSLRARFEKTCEFIWMNVIHTHALKYVNIFAYYDILVSTCCTCCQPFNIDSPTVYVIFKHPSYIFSTYVYMWLYIFECLCTYFFFIFNSTTAFTIAAWVNIYWWLAKVVKCQQSEYHTLINSWLRLGECEH